MKRIKKKQANKQTNNQFDKEKRGERQKDGHKKKMFVASNYSKKQRKFKETVGRN